MTEDKIKTAEVRHLYASMDGSPAGYAASEADFDRWLNTIKAEAIRETATLTTRRGQGFVYIKDILEYARRVARGG